MQKLKIFVNFLHKIWDKCENELMKTAQGL